VGSSTQVALFVAPLLVFVALLFGNPMDLAFTAFEVAAVALGVGVVTVISLESPSLLGEAFQRAGILRGSAAKDPLQREIAEYLGLSAPGEVLVAPVRLHDQVVNLLCIWTGAGERFPDDALQTLMELVQGAAAAYRALAERTKRQQ